MTDFATDSDVIAGIAASGSSAGFNQDIYKPSLTVAVGFDFSGWLQSGAPQAGVAPTTWAHPTKATAGAINPKYINGAAGTTCRILHAALLYSVAYQTVTVRDRVGHMAGLNGTLITAQTVNATLTAAAADGRCAVDGSDVEWFLEHYTATGSTSVNATCAVTYSDDSTGNIVVLLPASVLAYRMTRIVPASGNRTIKAISTVTLSASTLTAGNFGVTATKKLFSFQVPAANSQFLADWALLGMPNIGANACLYQTVFASSTAFGVTTGTIKAGVK